MASVLDITLPQGRRAYFVSDVHLGLQVAGPAERERRFVNFLRGIASDAGVLFMLGDIWDFWYEYRDVVPKGYVQVFAALQDLMSAGVEVYFFEGNHDVWSYHYFEEMGMVKLSQPCDLSINGHGFCLGHGDWLGPVPAGYRFLHGIFHSRVLQALFSCLHPWMAFRFGTGWSRHNRLARNCEYVFRGEDEPLYKFALEHSRANGAVTFIFGHYHVNVDMELPTGARLLVLKDWIRESPYMYFDGKDTFLGYSQNSEK